MTSPRDRSQPEYRNGEAGFTLIEIVVTLAILSLALVLIVGYKPPWSNSLGLSGAASELASGLRLARSEAIARNRPTAVELDLAKRQFRVGAGPLRQLPARLKIAMLTIAGERRDAVTGDIRFNPDGSSTGGRITLADDTRTILVGVDWLSGRVSVVNGK